MMGMAPGTQTLYSTPCTPVPRGERQHLLTNFTGTTNMKNLFIISLIFSCSASASVSPTGPEAAALKFNHWYIDQLLKGGNPLTDYAGLEPYVAANTIAALKISNTADPEVVDVPDSDMFIKAQNFEKNWQQIEIVSSDYDPVCMQVYVSFGAKQKHTVIDCMVKEDGAWKVLSVAGQEILRNVSLK
ncbi:DUF3828 domain-containing protein [Salmonella enterica subsp. houtenae]|nr:DUF3828 domain-containing protein [Salmonella enterica subsp. houtenae]